MYLIVEMGTENDFRLTAMFHGIDELLSLVLEILV